MTTADSGRTTRSDADKGLLLQRLEGLRKKLLDLSNRNRLLNFKHSDRSRTHVRVIDELPDILFRQLRGQKPLRFRSLPEPESEPEDEKAPSFLRELEAARTTDPDYKATTAKLREEDSDSNAAAKIERNLRDRLRDKLGMPAWKDETALSRADFARKHGLAPAYDLPAPATDGSDAERHLDDEIQTLLYPREMDRKLGGIVDQARTMLQEAGVSTLHAAFGFLEWREAERSETVLLSPLLLLPVLIERRMSKPWRNYSLRCEASDIEVNRTLRLRLGNEFGFDLPEFEAEETPESYLRKVGEHVAAHRGWRVRRFLTIGNFGFSKLAMYDDLNPENWPQTRALENHPQFGNLLVGKDDGRDSPIFASNHDVDGAEADQAPVHLVADADASQHSAVIDVVNGEDTVIKGPPGTGKSQTITNIISSLIANGKRVLFIAEKMAALDVVHSRMQHAQLHEFCLEVHSNKTSKTTVLNSIKERLAIQQSETSPELLEGKVAELKSHRDKLNECAALLSKSYSRLELTPHNILWGELRAKSQAGEECVLATEDIYIDDVTELTPLARGQKQAELKDAFGHLSGIIDEFGSIGDHPWYWIGATQLDPFKQDEATKQAERWRDELKLLSSALSDICDSWGFGDVVTLSEVENLCLAFEAVPGPPSHAAIQIASVISQRNLAQSARSLLAHYCNEAGECQKPPVGDPNTAPASLNWIELANRITSTIDKICSLAPGLPNLDGVSVHVNEVCGIIEFVQQSIELARSVTEAAGADSAKDSRSIINALTALKLICGADESHLELRNPALMERGARHLLDQALAKAESLKQQRSQIEADFVIKPLPDLDQVSSHARAVRGAGRFGWLKKEFRSATSFYREISVQREKFNPDVALVQLTRLESYLIDLSAFESDEDVRALCGSRFAGIDTNFADFLSVYNWIEEVRQVISDRSKLVDAVRSLVLAGDIERLLGLKSQARDFRIEDAIVEIEELAADGDDVGETVRDIAAEVHELASNCKNLKALGVSSLAAFSSIADCARCLADLEPLRADLHSSCEGEFQESVSIDLLAEAVTFLQALDDMDLPATVRTALLSENAPKAAAEIRESGVRLLALHESNIRAQTALYEVMGAKPEELADVTLNDWLDRLGRAVAYPSSLAPWVRFQSALQQASSDGLHVLVHALVELKAPVEKAIAAYNWRVFRSLARFLYEAEPELAKIHGLSINGLRERFQELDKEVLELERRRVRSQLCHVGLPQGNGAGRKRTYTNLHLIRNEIGKQKRHIPLRDLFTRAAEAIQQMKPCFMMSPLSVATYLPAGCIDFDVVVMDEASQLPLEDALGAIARAGQCVIVGDNMQLPPTSFFRRFDDAIEEEDEEEDEDLDVESVLDQGFSVFHPPRELRWHYRSRHQSLIAFSNKHFYENRLTVFPSFLEEHPDFGVELREVSGTYGKSENAGEVEAIGKWVVDFVRSNSQRSLGIVAINQMQRDLLNDELDRLAQEIPEVEAYRKKWEKGLYPLFVKNLENVQGDERDVIAVSTVYGRNADGRVAQNFGPISRKHGHRRLNVLFTRAREKLILFTSLRPDDIHIRDTTGPGPRALRNYLEFAKTGRLDPGKDTGANPDSDFEVEVANRIAAAGYEAVPQVGVAGYRVDIGIRHPEFPGMYLIGVECDGATYHSAKSARDRDRLREEVLRAQGWQLYRVWSTDWFRNSDIEMQKLISFVETCVTERRRLLEEQESQATLRVAPARVAESEAETEEATHEVQFPDDISSSEEPDGDLFRGLDAAEAESSVVTPAPQRPICETGDRVTFHYEDRANDTITVELAIGESDPSRGIVSYLSPVGEALHGAAEGDDVEVYLSDVTRTIIIDNVTKKESATASQPLGSDKTKSDEPDNSDLNESSKPAPSQYRLWSNRELPDPREAGQQRIAHALEEIVEAEGPVRVNRLYRLYANACGIARVGRVVRQSLDDALKALQRTKNVVVESEGPQHGDIDYRVVRPKDAPSVIVRTGDDRDFWEVPPSEIGAVLAEERRERPSADDETLYRGIISKFGISRLTRNIEAELKRIERDLVSNN